MQVTGRVGPSPSFPLKGSRPAVRVAFTGPVRNERPAERLPIEHVPLVSGLINGASQDPPHGLPRAGASNINTTHTRCVARTAEAAMTNDLLPHRTRQLDQGCGSIRGTRFWLKPGMSVAAGVS